MYIELSTLMLDLETESIQLLLMTTNIFVGLKQAVLSLQSECNHISSGHRPVHVHSRKLSISKAWAFIPVDLFPLAREAVGHPLHIVFHTPR